MDDDGVKAKPSRLGLLYAPTSFAYETASVVLGTTKPYACNVGLGCGCCEYCYGPRAFHKKDWANVRTAPIGNLEKLKVQVDKLKPEGVFLSFGTDPLLPQHKAYTEGAVKILHDAGVKTAMLTKRYNVPIDDTEHIKRHSYKDWSQIDLPKDILMGKTVVSFSNRFKHRWEDGADYPMWRLTDFEEYPNRWISAEPWPCPGICKIIGIKSYFQVLKTKRYKPTLIVFGKWNYNPLANTKEARQYYQTTVGLFRNFCEKEGIRLHIKKDTLKFLEGGYP